MIDQILGQRGLELAIRQAEAEERQLERRLDRLAEDQARARSSIEARLSDQLWKHYL